MSEITAVSLFTGAGGMDIGFEIRGDLAEHMDELKQYRGRRPCVRRNALPGVFGCRKMEQNDARSQLI